MKKTADMNIGTQLKIGFGIIILLVIVLSGVAWEQTNRIVSESVKMYNHPLKVRRAIDKLKSGIASIQIELQAYLLSENESGKNLSNQRRLVYESYIEDQFYILYDLYLGSKSEIDDVRDDFIKWKAAYDNVFKKTLIFADREKLMLKTTGINTSIELMLLIEHLKNIDEFALNMSDKLNLKMKTLKVKLHYQMAFLIALTIFFIIMIIYNLSKNIRTPIKELVDATNRFKRGERNARSGYISPNEFGLLSDSFNNMAETVGTLFTLNERVAILAEVMLSEDDAHNFCHLLLGSLLENTGSQMGAIYLLNEDKTEFIHFECIGMDAEGCKPFSATYLEGEFGPALANKKIQYITDIPEDTRFNFTTVSGKFRPREIITIPVVSGTETIAVISLSTIKQFDESVLRLLDTVRNTLSARIEGILAYRKIIAFSEILEHHNMELDAQKNELSAQANELAHQNIELEMQKKEVDEANRMKSIFLSSMSHELRTPLNSVIALSGVLHRRLDGKIPEEEYGYVEIIERNGKQLLVLINDILDLSRIESGKEDIDVEKFDLNKLISEVVDMIEPQAVLKNIYLSHSKENDIFEINSDYEKCRHVIQNIVANAVKFTEEGGVKISLDGNTDSVKIIINDTGIGIDTNFLPYIFDEFHQVDGSNSRRFGGTGLGLAIAKKYSDMLGGRIEVESIKGAGSCFTLSLPVNFISGRGNILVPDYISTFKAAKQSIGFSAEGKTILLVEDTEAIVIQMKDILETEGYSIMVARNGNEALDQIDLKIPDAMILDLMMPEVDGFEVLKRIRENKKTDQLPVIILTAKYITKEDLSFLKHNHIHQLIQKGDINKEQLLNEVAAMMIPKEKNVKSVYKKPRPFFISGAPVILVVEDNIDNMKIIKALLDTDCKIIEAVNGRSAIELAERHKPHLVLMDIALPDISGTEVLKTFRNDESLDNVPVIAVSASAMKGDRENFLELGFDDYISKPIDNIIFLKTVKKALYGIE